MKKQWITIIGGGALAISLAAVGIGLADTGSSPRITGTVPVADQAEAEFPAMAKITLNRAMENAVESTQGKVLKAELEDEDGFLVYSVEVVSPDRTITDVTLDAGTGKVLAMRKDRADGHDDEKGDRERGDHEEHEGDE